MAKVTRCRSCGADIIWIRMKSGKVMPCNAQRISYKNSFPKGDLTLVTPDGKIAKGIYDPESENFGYESHFATCPAAEAYRRRQK